jgi:uncharacterized ferritin-like protein (DUF455 family)
MSELVAPPAGTVERWAFDYVLATELSMKLDPPPVPAEWERSPTPRRIDRPGRPPELRIAMHSDKTPGPGALRNPARRAALVHRFLHHELQAAELMSWALLAFPLAPRAFKRGLVRIAQDEIAHMAAYRQYLAALGFAVGSFPVRDWFWQRIPSVPTPAHFVAVMGMGLEGGNLDHSARFAERLRAAGDTEGARLLTKICVEEIPHVRFALRWFRRWVDDADFSAWAGHLPPPLSPWVMRGAPLNRADRIRAGYSQPFLDELERWRDKDAS